MGSSGRKKFFNKREILWYEQGGLCHFCGKEMIWRDFSEEDKMGPDDATIDHLDEMGHLNRGKERSTRRLVLSCYRCNQARGLDYSRNKHEYSRMSFFEEFNPVATTFLTDEL
jgi:hypothetical protein